MRQFAVIGLGRFGSSIARTLSRMGYEVLAVDKDEEKVNDLTDEVTCAVQVDAIEEQALESLGLGNFDVVIVAIGYDIKASVLITVILKEMGVPKIVTKAQDKLHGRVLQKIGADVVVFPERDMGIRLAHALVSRNILDEIHLSPDYSIVELIAPVQFRGKTIGETALRQKYGITLIAIRRGEDIIISPGAKQVIREDDVLVVLGREDRLKQLDEEK